MDLDAYPYRATFQAVAKVISPSTQDQFVAKASLEQLKGMIPENLDVAGNPDLLFIAADSAVASLCNRNDDCMSAATSIAVNNTARYKFIDVQHERDQIVGVVIEPGFSRFGSSEPLTTEEASQLKEPFNTCFVAALWKTAAPMLTKYITKTSGAVDEESMSISFEIAFAKYSVGVGSTNLFEARVIAPDDTDFAAYSKLLRANGGPGKDQAGNKVYRVIDDKALILGFGIVTQPAAHVKGILAIGPEEPKEEDKADEPAEAKLNIPITINAEPIDLPDGSYPVIRYGYTIEILDKSYKTNNGVRNTRENAIAEIATVENGNVTKIYYWEDAIKQANEAVLKLAAAFKCIADERGKKESLTVKIQEASAQNVAFIVQNPQEKKITSEITSVKSITKSTMKIESLQQLDEQWAEIRKLESSAAVKDFVESIEKGSKEYVTKLQAAENLAEQFKVSQAEADKRAKELEATLANVQKELAEVRANAEASAAQQKFSERMASFDEKFDLDDEDRKFIAEDVRAIPAEDDAAFDAYARKCDRLMSAKKKGAKPFPPKDKKEDGKDKEPDGDEMKAALASVQPIDGQTTVPKVVNAALPADEDLLVKMKNAFGNALSVNGKSAAKLTEEAAAKNQ